MILFFGTRFFYDFHIFYHPRKAHYVSEQRMKHESGLEPRRHRAKQAVKQVLTVIGPAAAFLTVSIVIFMRFFRRYLFASRDGSWIYVGFYDLMFRKQFPLLSSSHTLHTRKGLFPESDKGLRRRFRNRCRSDIISVRCRKKNCKKDFAKQIATQSILR